MTIHQQSLVPQPLLTEFPKCVGSCNFFLWLQDSAHTDLKDWNIVHYW